MRRLPSFVDDGSPGMDDFEPFDTLAGSPPQDRVSVRRPKPMGSPLENLVGPRPSTGSS